MIRELIIASSEFWWVFFLFSPPLSLLLRVYLLCKEFQLPFSLTYFYSLTFIIIIIINILYIIYYSLSHKHTHTVAKKASTPQPRKYTNKKKNPSPLDLTFLSPSPPLPPSHPFFPCWVVEYWPFDLFIISNKLIISLGLGKVKH